jgi:hypothetical protein
MVHDAHRSGRAMGGAIFDTRSGRSLNRTAVAVHFEARHRSGTPHLAALEARRLPELERVRRLLVARDIAASAAIVGGGGPVRITSRAPRTSGDYGAEVKERPRIFLAPRNLRMPCRYEKGVVPGFDPWWLVLERTVAGF